MSYSFECLNKKVFPSHALFLAEVAKDLGCEVEWIDRWTGLHTTAVCPKLG
ncbi:MAG: hypothetical protein ACOZAR_03905 [Patescibacteria group bacterium]